MVTNQQELTVGGMFKREMGFALCQADSDVWMRPGTKANGLTYCRYILLYTYVILATMEEPEQFN